MPSTATSPDTHTQELIRDLLGSKLGDFEVGPYIARGASALVFQCQHEEQTLALKVFDPVFLKKFEESVQTERIARQLELMTASHPNLVSIIGGGRCSSRGLHYLAMPFYAYPSLDTMIQHIPADRIRPIISQVASAARYLEEIQWVHRDIKPANIAISKDFSKAILLDLGVIRQFKSSDLTDSTDTKGFVGTTRYSPPEFVTRTEEENPNGWRAVTFYQLGAVLHDMLKRKPLFENITPYGNLVRAIIFDEPDLTSINDHQDLSRLCRLCLQKNPKARLASVNWEMFEERPPRPSINELREKIKSTRNVVSLSTPTTRNLSKGELTDIAVSLKNFCISEGDLFPPHDFRVEINSEIDIAFTFTKSQAHSTPFPLHILVQVSPLIDPANHARIRCCAIASQSPPDAITPAWDSDCVVEIEDEVESHLKRYLFASLLAITELKNSKNIADPIWLKAGEI